MNGKPVRDLQEMLQFLAYAYPAMPQVIPDGRFGERTLEAVMVFQRDHHLPVTGKVDFETWSAIYEAWRRAYHQIGTPSPLRVLHNGNASIRNGDQMPPVPIIQAMFDAISHKLRNFKGTELDGVFHSRTLENTKQLQRVYGLEQSGEMDRATWEGLARLYQMFITRQAVENIT